MFNSTKCCAYSEITGLSSHTTPKDAMITFCRANLNQAESRVMYHTAPSTQNRLYSFYLFSAAIATPTRKDTYLSNIGDDYGSKFAKFILENKLGEIVESPLRPNMAFHEDHSNKIWIWATDQGMIEKWWEAEKKSNAILKAEQEKALSQLKTKPIPCPLASINKPQVDGYQLRDVNEDSY